MLKPESVFPITKHVLFSDVKKTHSYYWPLPEDKSSLDHPIIFLLLGLHFVFRYAVATQLSPTIRQVSSSIQSCLVGPDRSLQQEIFLRAPFYFSSISKDICSPRSLLCYGKIE